MPKIFSSSVTKGYKVLDNPAVVGQPPSTIVDHLETTLGAILPVSIVQGENTVN